MSQVSKNHISVSNPLSKNALTNGDFFFGVSGGDDYGETINTNFYNGIIPPVGGYTIYQNVFGDIYANVANNDEECIWYLQSLGSSYTNISDALTWAATQPNITVRSSEYQLSDLSGGGGGSAPTITGNFTDLYSGDQMGTLIDVSGYVLENFDSLTVVSYNATQGGADPSLSIVGSGKYIALTATATGFDVYDVTYYVTNQYGDSNSAVVTIQIQLGI